MGDDNWMWIIIVLAVFGLLVTCAVRESNAYEAACKAKGGHVVDMYKSALCVSADGKILDGE